MKPGVAFLSLAVTFFAADIEAAAITFHFEGLVDQIEGPLVGELLGASLPATAPGVLPSDLLGTSFHGSFTFHPDALDRSANPNAGSYVGAGFGSILLHLAHQSFPPPFFVSGLEIAVFDNYPALGLGVPGLPGFGFADLYVAVSHPLVFTSDPLVLQYGVLLSSHSLASGGPETALVGDALPLSPPDIHTFDMRRAFANVLRHEEIGGGQFAWVVRGTIGGTLASLTVPEPGLTALFAIGLTAVGIRYRRMRP
jgi:hypothetical protein